MGPFADQMLVLVLLVNFIVLGTSRLVLAVRAVALQGVALGMLPILIYPPNAHLIGITVGIILVKGVLIPFLIMKALENAHISREQHPLIEFVPTVIIGAILTGLSFVFSEKLPVLPEHQNLIFVPTAISTIMTGFLLLAVRRKAVSQVTGYLILENGIFIFGLLLSTAMPLMVEAGVLLDLLVAIFVMGIVINQIGREFNSLDTSRLTSLKEE